MTPRSTKSIRRLRLGNIALASLMWAGACASPPTAPAQDPAPTVASSEDVSENEASCPDDAAIQEAQAQFEEARALLEDCGEECMKSATEGERYRRGLALLRQASAGGHLEAQAMYGVRSFGDLMTTGDEPELEEEYVEAIASLRAAAVRGDSGAADYVPGIATVKVIGGRRFEPALEEPLSLLPREWVVRGIERGDKMAACAPTS